MRYNFDMGKGPVKIEWMVGAQTNICHNALDHNVEAGHGDRVAFYWVGNSKYVEELEGCTRTAHALAMAEGLEALLDDGPDRYLELGRAKLLLAPPPAGFHLRTEVAHRHSRAFIYLKQ